MNKAWGVLFILFVSGLALEVNAETHDAFAHKTLLSSYNTLRTYHSKLPIQADHWTASLGNYPCELSNKNQQVNATPHILIVLDRGGNGPYELGKQSHKILKGLQTFFKQHFKAKHKLSFKFAIVDLYGNGQVDSTEFEAEKKPLIKIIKRLKPSQRAGSNVFGEAKAALPRLSIDGQDLNALVMITDGIDPSEKDSVLNLPNELIKKAKELSIPIHTLHIDKRKLPKHPNPRKLSVAFNRLKHIAEETNGSFYNIKTKGLATALAKALSSITGEYKDLTYSECQFCVNHDDQSQTRNIQISYEYKNQKNYIPKSRGTRIYLEKNKVKTCTSGLNGACSEDSNCEIDYYCKNDKCQPNLKASLQLYKLELLGVLSFLMLGIFFFRRRYKKQKLAHESLTAQYQEVNVQLNKKETAAKELENQLASYHKDISQLKNNIESHRRVILRISSLSTEFTFDRTLSEGTFTLGANQDCDLFIDLSSVSGSHLELKVTSEGKAYITDLESSNGTYLNGMPLSAYQMVEIISGDEVFASKSFGFLCTFLDDSQNQ